MLYDKRWEQKAKPVEIAPEPWRALLLKAARIIERGGWCCGTLYQQARSCALGALNRAETGRPSVYGDSPAYWAARRILLDVVRERAPGATIESWNDGRARDAKDVIATMRKAAHIQI